MSLTGSLPPKYAGAVIDKGQDPMLVMEVRR